MKDLKRALELNSQRLRQNTTLLPISVFKLNIELFTRMFMLCRDLYVLFVRKSNSKCGVIKYDTAMLIK